MNCGTALQTSRLSVRPFSEDDLDELSALMANADFMRFSLGVLAREQTAGFLEKVRGPSHWGQGIATEAARAVRDHAFDELPLPRVMSLIHPENIASRRVAEKNGMMPEKETIFRGFPTIVFGINRKQRTGA